MIRQLPPPLGYAIAVLITFAIIAVIAWLWD